MITILMPIYNGIEYIEESISSIKEQTFKQWELIIGVNGHPKNSDVFQKANTYSSTNIHVLDMENTNGKSMALNQMLRHAKYKWICLLDVDDKWVHTKLERQIIHVKDFDVIGTFCQYFGDSNDFPKLPQGDISNFDFYKFNPIINSSCLVKKDLCYWDTNESVNGIEDYDMWLRLWRRRCKFFNVNSVQVYHRIHQSSAFNAQGNHMKVPNLISKHKQPCITFATAWYEVKSKFDPKKYTFWMKNVLQHVNHFNLVIFTNNESKKTIESCISNYTNIKIVVKEFDQFLGDKWNVQWAKNQKRNHCLNENSPYNIDWKLNMIWNEKIHFVKEASAIHQTDYYGWMDIGYFRDGPIHSSWCSPERIFSMNIDKIYYAKICSNIVFNSLKKHILDKNDKNLPNTEIPMNQISIAGGFFVLHKTKLQWWHDTFYQRLQLYFDNDYLVKDDQIVIIDCIINNWEHFNLIENNAPENSAPRWFVFQQYLQSNTHTV